MFALDTGRAAWPGGRCPSSACRRGRAVRSSSTCPPFTSARQDALQRVGHPCLVVVGTPVRLFGEKEVHVGTGQGPDAIALSGGRFPSRDQGDRAGNVLSLALARRS